MQLSHPAEAQRWVAALNEAAQRRQQPQPQLQATAAGALLTGVSTEPQHLEDMPAFVGAIDRHTAERLLEKALPRFPGGTYLVRVSQNDGKLALSWMRAPDKKGHVKVRHAGARRGRGVGTSMGRACAVKRCLRLPTFASLCAPLARHCRSPRTALASTALRRRRDTIRTRPSCSCSWTAAW